MARGADRDRTPALGLLERAVPRSSIIIVTTTRHRVLPAADGRAANLHRTGSEPRVTDSNPHWRPWVNGLPVGSQPISWITGRYENGVFYYYIATWGRGIWKREARGRDL